MRDWSSDVCSSDLEFMAFAIRRPKKVVAAALATLLFNLLLLPFLGTELQPVYDSGEFIVGLKAPAGTGLDQMKVWAKPLEETIAAIPEVEVEALHLGGNRTPVNEGDIRVRLKPLRERSRGMLDIMAELRKKFADVGVMQVSVMTTQGYSDRKSVV